MSLPANSFTSTPEIGVWGCAKDSYSLPHPPVSPAVIKLICKVLAHSFVTLQQQDRSFVAMSENEITEALQVFIENTVLKADGDETKGGIPGFTRVFFRSVTRQSNVRKYDRSTISSSPDVWFHLSSERRGDVLPGFDAVLAECKIIDKNRKRRVNSWYCAGGLMRFVDGTYAWAMTEGLMVAFTRDGRSLAGNLLPVMVDAQQTILLQTLLQPKPLKSSPINLLPEPIHRSQHRREFDYLEGKGKAKPISIYHLWLPC